MGKSLWIAVLIASAVACKSSKTDNGDSEANQSSGGGNASSNSSMSSSGSGAEGALRSLGIAGAVSTLDMNQAKFEGGAIRISRVHMTREFVLAEGSGKKPRVIGIQRSNLRARWISNLPEPSAFAAGENSDVAFFVSKHYFTPVDLADGRRTFQLSGSEVRGPAKQLPFTPTAGATGMADTAYIPSLGSSINNKKIESFGLYDGARGWGWRALGDITNAPEVGGPTGDPKLYFVTSNGVATCLDAKNYGFGPQNARWSEPLNAGVAQGHAPFLTDDTKDLVGAYYVIDRAGTAYCLDRITGRRRWSNATGGNPTGGPVVFGDVCVIPMSDGLTAFEKENVLYMIEVMTGSDVGKKLYVMSGKGQTVGREGTDLVLSDGQVKKIHLNLKVEGEVLFVGSDDEATMKIDGQDLGKRASVENGAQIKIGDTVLRVHDIGRNPLWKSLPYDRIVARIGKTLVAAKGNTLTAIDAYTGEPKGSGVNVPGVRLIPTNPYDEVLVVVTGEGVIHALYPR